LGKEEIRQWSSSKSVSFNLGVEMGYRGAFLLLFLCGVLLPGCKTPLLESKFPDREVAVDGSNKDWAGTVIQLQQDGVALGVMNDSCFVYLCMIVMDPQKQMRILSDGMTVWFDSKGGKGKTFGVHYPISMWQKGMSMPRGDDGGMDTEKFRKAFDFYQDELEIIGPAESDRKREPLHAVPGLQVKAGIGTDRLVYELKIPLKKSKPYPYAVGADIPGVLALGFETPEMERGPGRGMFRPSSGGAGAGQPSGGGKGGGRGGGRGGGMMGGGDTASQPSGDMGPSPEGPRPLKFWIHVNLASVASGGPSEEKKADE
jgi:hypothetical protein